MPCLLALSRPGRLSSGGLWDSTNALISGHRRVSSCRVPNWPLFLDVIMVFKRNKNGATKLG